jgi:hypothetical protein
MSEQSLRSVNASKVLAFGMATIYVRDVPEDVAARLAEVARAQNTSVQSLALRELTALARRSRNREILESSPTHEIDPQRIVDALHAERAS